MKKKIKLDDVFPRLKKIVHADITRCCCCTEYATRLHLFQTLFRNLHPAIDAAWSSCLDTNIDARFTPCCYPPGHGSVK